MAQAAIRRERKSTSRKAELVDVATKIFMEKGYKETGIEVILNQAGLTGPALYRHFSSKQNILDTICLAAGRHMQDIVREVRNKLGLSSRERMAKLIELRLDYLFSEAGAGSFLAASQRAHLSKAAQTQLYKMNLDFETAFSKFLSDFRPELSHEERRLIYYAVQNMVLYGIWRSRSRGLVSEEEYREILEKMVWNTVLA